MLAKILVVVAGLMGAGGVALAAASAHAKPGAGLDSAAYMLLFHAAAILGAVALARHAALWRPVALAAPAGFVIGALLFSGDIALRAFTGGRLFPMAAPTGGTILIVSWIVLAVAAIAGE